MTVIVSDLAYLEAKKRREARGRFLWTCVRDEQLKHLRSIGVDTAIIAVMMRIGEQTVLRRLALLGLKPSAGKYND